MAWTSSQITELETAIFALAVNGFASVTVAGQTVTSHDLDRLRKLLAEMKADVAVTSESGGIVRRKIMPYYR